MDIAAHGSANDPLPFEFGTFEINDPTNPELG
jgi:hypothetical protein